MSKFFLGADPGLNGAIAVLDWANGQIVTMSDTPTFTLKGKLKIDMRALCDLVDNIAAIYAPALAVLEEVHAMPEQGVVSTFNFGFNAAALQMAVVAAGLPMRLVPASAWKRIMGVTADKDSSRLMASRLLPASAHLWARKKDDGRAEAALLAYYASKNA